MTPLDGHRAQLRADLEALETAGLRRRLRTPGGIDLVSNDYLGLAQHPHLLAALHEVTRAGAGGSRLLRGHHAFFDEVESRLAAWCGAPQALLFSSGYATNVGLLQALLTKDDAVFSDAANHASLIDGIRLSGAHKAVYPHQDLDALESALRTVAGRRKIVVTESVFSMDGDRTPLADVVALAERHGAAVIVDEAHATGLYGARGSGCVEADGLRDRVLATIHTGGKALGSGGAWVAGPPELRDLLVNRARSFVFSTAPLPALATLLHAGLDVVAREPERRSEVHRKSVLLRSALAESGHRTLGDSPIVPVIVGGNEATVSLADALAEDGFDARAVRPPTVPDGTARLRLTVRYPVADDDLRRFAACLARRLPSAAA